MPSTWAIGIAVATAVIAVIKLITETKPKWLAWQWHEERQIELSLKYSNEMSSESVKAAFADEAQARAVWLLAKRRFPSVWLWPWTWMEIVIFIVWIASIGMKGKDVYLLQTFSTTLWVLITMRLLRAVVKVQWDLLTWRLYAYGGAKPGIERVVGYPSWLYLLHWVKYRSKPRNFRLRNIVREAWRLQDPERSTTLMNDNALRESMTELEPEYINKVWKSMRPLKYGSEE